MSVRPLRIDGDLAFVPLTQGLEAIIDAQDGNLVGRYNWHADRGYAQTKLTVSQGRQRALRMHTMILAAPTGYMIDHINRNGLDNRRCNLRLATSSENNCNRSIFKTNTSGFKGVSYDNKRQSWRAEIKFEKKYIWLGYFKTPEEAHAAYRDSADRFHGDYRAAEAALATARDCLSRMRGQP